MKVTKSLVNSIIDKRLRKFEKSMNRQIEKLRQKVLKLEWYNDMINKQEVKNENNI